MFAWGGVSGAVKYEFQLANTSSFASTVADFMTFNRRATVATVLPNDTYYLAGPGHRRNVERPLGVRPLVRLRLVGHGDAAVAG